MDESTVDDLAKALRGGWNDFVVTTAGMRRELFAFGLRLTGNPFDAEDLVQEALVRAFGAAAFQDGGIENPRSYLFRIMSNLWIDQQRRARDVLFAVVTEADRAVEDVDSVALGDAAERVLQLLAPRERAAIVLHEAFGYRHAEIAELLATTEGAVRSALHRAKRRLSEDRDVPKPSARGADPVVVERFVKAFVAADMDAMQDLLAEGVETIVFPAGVGHGAEKAAEEGWLRGSLFHHDPALEDDGIPYPNHVRVVELAGEPVVAVSREGEGGILLEEIWRFETRDGVVTRVRDYCFCPDLVSWAGSTLETGVRPGPYTFGQRFEQPVPPARRAP